MDGQQPQPRGPMDLFYRPMTEAELHAFLREQAALANLPPPDPTWPLWLVAFIAAAIVAAIIAAFLRERRAQ